MNVNYRLFGAVLGWAISVHDLYKVNQSANVITDTVAFIICLLSLTNHVDMMWIFVFFVFGLAVVLYKRHIKQFTEDPDSKLLLPRDLNATS